MITKQATLYKSVFRFLSRTPNAVLVFGLVGFLLPMIYGFIFGFPIPHVHDELSYLLAADTFANGNLTNPTPQFWEHFESPHILLTPSYMSKYPPMQGLFMATGQFTFGHPIYGVWLSCGAAAASLFWMLTGWTRVRWAFLGTLLMIVLVGINGYWAQSYWGGMPVAVGGALFFGGFRRLFKKLSFWMTSIMVLGGVVMVNSRPFEGFLTMLPALTVLFVWLLRDKANFVSRKFSQVVLPGFLFAGIALSAMFYYNFRVTGNVFNLPYAEHTRQYLPTPLFIFQSTNEAAIKGHSRLREFYESYDNSDAGFPRVLSAFFELIFLIPFFLLSPPLMIFLYVTAPLLIYRNKWFAFVAGTILFVFAWMSLAVWYENYHYAASLTCLFFLLVAEGFRQFAVLGKIKEEFNKSITVGLLTVLVLASFLYSQVVLPESVIAFTGENTTTPQITFDKAIKLTIPGRATFLKAEIEQSAEKLPNKYLAIVSFDAGYSFHDEIVYNKANIENSKLIWAYDLGAEKNEALLSYYKDRKILVIKVSDSQLEINPLP